MSDAVLQCTSLTKRFSEAELSVDVLRGIDLDVKTGERIAIIGTSGSGKSTLLHLLGGLDKPSSGTVSICGYDLSNVSEKSQGELRNQYMGFIYQFHHLLPEFTAEENVAMPLIMGKTSPQEASRKAQAILDKVGLAKRVHHKPAELSGGERQRAAIARALVSQPRCLLADEPTGNLDSDTSDQIFNLMMELNQEIGTSVIMVTHNNELASRMDRQYRLQAGLLHEI